MAAIATAAPSSPELTFTGSDRYRLALIDHSGSMVLLHKAEGGHILPELAIPKFTRTVEQITTRLRESWGFPAFFLSSQVINKDSGDFYAAFEIGKGKWGVPVTLKWFPIERISAHLNEADVCFVLASSAKALQISPDVDPGPFSRLGWIYQLRDWVESIVGPRGIRIRTISQLSGSENTALIKFDTNASPLWFKAVGLADPQEFANTHFLAAVFPEYLPEIMAFDPTRNAWLMQSGGEKLESYESLTTWSRVARHLASLQIQSASWTPQLPAKGFLDLRVTRLLDSISPFFEVIQDLMERQTKSSPPPLAKHEVLQLIACMGESLRELADIGIPDTVGHTDFNPGNILISGDRSAFIDWSAAHVGHPLLTLEYLLAHRRKTYPGRLDEEHILREAYAENWLNRIAPKRMARALRLAPLVAVYAYAIGINSWQEPGRLSRPDDQAYLRSLARIMNREAQSVRAKEDACLPS
jgi:hypothetical protein